MTQCLDLALSACNHRGDEREGRMSEGSGLAGVRVCAATAALLALATSLFAFQSEILEVIDAQAFGTSTQMGQVVPIKLLVTNYSTEEDEKTLKDAFRIGQNDGLVRALHKMRPVGRIQIPGTLGFEIAFLSSETTPTGRAIRFLTDRKIELAEAFRNTPSQAYNLTGGRIEINTQDARKSTGSLYPAAQLVINRDGELEIALRKDFWRLSNISVRQVGQKK